MAKSVKIKEGSGAWQTESTDIIKTQLVEGGTQKWVPEEQYKSLLEKKVLNVTANGTYTPASFDCDCFSKVVVKLGDGSNEDGSNKYKGPNTVTGTDPNTNEPTSVSTDEDGNLVFSQIPAFIKVTTPPNTTSYSEGETIDYTGIIVCAYKADGSAFPLDNGSGTFGNQIPFSELTFPVTIATTGETASESSHSSGGF